MSETDRQSPARRIAFRFACCYLVLHNLPFPLSLPPIGGPVATVYNRFWYAVIPWIGAHVLHLGKPITVFPSGSGDTRFNYVQILVFAVLALTATVIWSIVDRRRADYRRLAQWLSVYLRYALAFPLLTYGAAKLVKLQFPTPSLETMLQPYRDFSPQGALWAWMGISYPYNLFTGLAESVPGVLLLFRRTRLLGALLGAAALANVVIINFAYDVPVKLYSSHLLLMALFLIGSDARRLVDLFLLHRSVPPADVGAYPKVPSLKLARAVIKTIVVAAAISVPLIVSWTYAKQFGDRVARPPLYGIYRVDTFVRNRDTVPPLLSDATRWERLVISRPGFASVRRMDDTPESFRASVDTGRRVLELTPVGDSSRRYSVAYRDSRDALLLDGLLGADTLHLRLRRVDPAGFRVMSGWRWFGPVELMIFLVLATSLVLGWVIASRTRREAPRRYQWITALTRHGLAFTLVLYGVDKLVKIQFPPPSLETLLRPFGDLTPQGALWSWMGVSFGYTVFTAGAELGAGVLLLFHRTATLGALLAAGAMSNIVALNFAYDVPVKVFSSLLLLAALLLLVPNWRQLTDLFLRNRPVAALDLGPYLESRLARPRIKWAIVGGTLVLIAGTFSALSLRLGGWAAKPPLYGIYAVERFVRDRDTLPPSGAEGTRWNRLVIGRSGDATIRLVDGSAESFRSTVDRSRGELRLTPVGDAARRFALAYDERGGTLSLDGLLGAETLHVRLRRLDPATFPVFAGFHWVRE